MGGTQADGKSVNGMARELWQCQKFVGIEGNPVDSVPT